jgi:hypothetical protein
MISLPRWVKHPLASNLPIMREKFQKEGKRLVGARQHRINRIEIGIQLAISQ